MVETTKAAIQRDERLVKIDSRRSVHNGPKVRHLAVISKIDIPGFDGDRNKILSGEIAATVCGRYIRDFWNAEQVSYFYTDGSKYSTPCERCLPEEVSK